MPAGLQELLALAFVAAIVGFGLWRRWRRGAAKQSSCAGCGDDSKPGESAETPVRFYRRED